MPSPTLSVDLQHELYDVIKTSPRNVSITDIKNKWEQSGYKWSDEMVKLAELYHNQVCYLEMSC
jgi:hypothetical protein